MAKYVLPFWEEQTGFYVIEADTLEEARSIVELGDFTEDHEPHYKSGVVEWDVDQIYEAGVTFDDVMVKEVGDLLTDLQGSIND
jgi:hypothetical protein